MERDLQAKHFWPGVRGIGEGHGMGNGEGVRRRERGEKYGADMGGEARIACAVQIRAYSCVCFDLVGCGEGV